MYNVQAELIAIQIDDEVKNRILDFLKTYDFPYVKSIKNKPALREIFVEHFENRHNLKWLKNEINAVARREDLSPADLETIALSETNRLHTQGLGSLLLSKGIKKCTTENSYGTRAMCESCWKNLEGEPRVINDITVKSKPKILDIEQVIKNSFPTCYGDLMRTDVPMIPQCPNCFHTMAPLEE